MELPFEIWSNIAEYIPREDLSSLRAVNHALYQLVQALEYRNVEIATFNKGTKRMLKNLVKPSLRNLVRSVHIQPWFVPNTKSKSSSGLIFRLYDRTHTFFDPDYPQRLANTLMRKRILKHTRLVTEALRNLDGVQEYRISWDRERRCTDDLFTAFLAPLLADTPLGITLAKLSLEVPIDKLPCLAMVRLPRLEALDVHLHTENLPPTCIDDYLDPFVVFIHSSYLTLRSLSISSSHSSENLDLHRFFHNLGYFPNLHSFALSIPYDGAHLSSSAALRAFIGKHCEHLEELKLRCTRCAFRAKPIDVNSKYWIQNTITSLGVYYPILRKLELALRPLRADLTPVLDCLGGLAAQLESLTLTDRALTVKEVERILDALDHPDIKLQNLSIKLQYLCPEIVELLAARLPFLHNLALTFTEVLPYDTELSFSQCRSEDLKLFLERMRQWSDPGWRLSRMCISECQYDNLQWADDMERVFVGCIPALCSFGVLPS